MIRFDGQVALVTGAGKGIGRAHAESLASRGARVVVNNRRHPEESSGSADEVAAAIREAGGEAVASYEHVERPGAGQRMVDEALEAFGRLDVLICNAGVSRVAMFHKLSMAEIREIVDINLLGTLEPIHAALPQMREQRFGRILVTTSSSALFGDAAFSAYAASKAALHGLVASLAQEGPARGIGINAIVPFAHTDMTDRLFAEGHFPAESAHALSAQAVADLATWLVSGECARSGEIWIAGGRVFGAAQCVQGPGVEVDATAVSPEWLAEHSAEVAEMRGARAFESGGDMLSEIAQRSLKKVAGQG